MSFSTLTQAKDLAVVDSYVACLGKKDMGLFKYRVALILKNTSNKNLILITKFNGMSLFDKTQAFFTDAGAVLLDGMKLIKPESELGLVEIYPGEGTQVTGFLFSSKSISP